MSSSLKKRIVTDALTGEKIEVIVGDSGKLWHIEGFSYEFLNSITPPYRAYLKDSSKNKE